MLRTAILLLTAVSAFARSNPVDLLTKAVALPSGEGISLDFTFPQPEILQMAGGVQVRLADEGLLGIPGCPDLPLVNRLIRIPAESDISFEVVNEAWVSMGTYTVAPLQERLHTELDLPLPWIQDETVFQDSQPWPAQWIQMTEPMLLRETRLVKLSIAPIRWNPVTGELMRLQELSMNMSFQGKNYTNVPSWSEMQGISDDNEGVVYSRLEAEGQFMRQMLGDLLIDYEELTDENGMGEMNDISWNAPELPLNYLVFAKTSLQSQAGFQSWLDWKRRKGHHVTVMGQGDVTSWSAVNIRNAIISQYQSGAYPPHYVMLVGDPTASGDYMLPTSNSEYDHSYAKVSGSDVLADVVVGRVSVTSATELNTVFNKIVGYEQTPYLDNTSWLRRASFLTGSGHCGESMSQLCRDFAIQLVDERDYAQVDTAFCANSPSYVYNWFNAGISHYTYRGWIGMEGLNRDQLRNLSQGARTPVAVVFTCNSGDFATDNVSYTEAFLRGGSTNEPGGAVAAMGFCTSGTHTAYNNLVTGGFWSALLDNRIPQVGTCMFRGKLDLFNSLPPGDGNISSFSNWANLMGDPGMEQWCGVPQLLHFEHVPSELGSGAQALELRVLDGSGEPVTGVAVCAFSSTDNLALGLTDENGEVTLGLAELTTTSLSLIATKAFHKPAMETVTMNAGLAMPVIHSVTVLDENGDGAWTPGELATLEFTLANHSTSEALPALGLVLEAGDENAVEIIAGIGGLGPLGPSEVGVNTGVLQVRADSSWTEGFLVALDLRFTGGAQEFLLRTFLELSTPTIFIGSAAWTSTPLYPGQTSGYSLRLGNNGNRTSRQLHVELAFPEGSGMTLWPTSLDLDSLAVDETVNINLQITAAGNLVPGYFSTMQIRWSDQSIGASGELPNTVTLGNQQVTDPTGPDAHGYYAFESTDTQWSQSPIYNWIEIAPAAGGQGTLVTLPDNGDEQDASRTVQLPFHFTLYGQSYTSMAVCSNGFVAFGPHAHLFTDFRNHYLPSGMGPEPMLAAMWDDHKLTGDAQVATRYLEEQGIFIVEWYRMRTNSNNRINTFQLLLHNPAVYITPTGDGDVIYQYHTFDDTQDNSQDFPYCTVGLKNQDATIGMTLLNYHRRPTTMSPIAAGKAIRLSTSIGLTTEPSHMTLSETEVAVGLSETTPEEVAVDITIGNTGASPLTWSATVFPDGAWPPAGLRETDARDSGGPDSHGYIWRDSNENNGPAAGWVDVWDLGQDISLDSNDDFVGPIDLPFAFPFYGSMESQLWISANGFVSFQELDGPYFQNNVATIPHENAPDKSLMIWWDDLLTNQDLNGHIRWWTNNVDSLVVTWLEAPHYNQAGYGGPFTFQVVIEPSGRITYNYGDMTSTNPNSDSGSIAMQLNASTGFSIRQMALAASNYTIQILPPFWLTLVSNSGIVFPGQEATLTMTVRNSVIGLMLPEGDYAATLLIESNDPEQQTVAIPVTLHVGDVELADPTMLPLAFAVGDAYPNPFNPVTTLDYSLPEALFVKARLFNVAGQVVGTLANGLQPAGSHQLTVDGARLASGVYLVKLEAGSHSAVRKLTLLK